MPDIQGTTIEEFAEQRNSHGITCDEIERRFGFRHQAASAKISRMKQTGILVPNGERRKTASGRMAEVLVHYKFAPPGFI